MTKKLFRFLALAVFPILGATFIRLLYFTNKKRFFLPSQLYNEPVVFAFWHADLLMLPYFYLKLRSSPKIKLMISEHFDGQLIAKTVRYLHFDTIHGSTTRGGARVLIQALKGLDDGYDIGLTPDGPKGPRYSISDGVVVLAQKRQAKVVVLHCVPSSFWQLSSWDKFIIPKPFGMLQFYASAPIDLTGLEMEDAKKIVYQALMEHALP